MITLTRREIGHVRAVLRRAGLARPAAGGPAIVCITAGPDGIRFRASSSDLVAEYRIDRSSEPMQLAVPLAMFDACHGKSAEPVAFTKTSRGELEVEWTDRGIPQLLVDANGEPVDSVAAVPVPEEICTNPTGLWQALVDAAAAGTSDSSRFALDAIQLRGEAGQIIATDGRQALVQSGYQFPWSEDLLIGATGIFRGREIAPNGQVLVGQIEDWVYLATAGWSFWCKTDRERRFPLVHSILRSPEQATARVSLSESDAQFWLKSLPCLPNDESHNHPVTLVLDRQALIRSRAEGGIRTLELVLMQSAPQGEPVTVALNRRFLAHSLKLGFRELYLFGDSAPAQFQDAKRQYVFALLAPESALKPVDDAVQLRSSSIAAAVAPLTHMKRSPTRRHVRQAA